MIEDNEELTTFDSNYEDTVSDSDTFPSNHYFKKKIINSAFKKKANAVETAQQFSSTYLELLNHIESPILQQFFHSKENFYCKDFYEFAVQNFVDFNEEELNFISRYLVPEKFTYNIFSYVLECDNHLTSKQFNSIFSQKLGHNFNDIYLTHLMTKYAIQHFEEFDEKEQDLLWSKIDLSFSKLLFLKSAINKKVKIHSSQFFHTLKHESHTDIISYFKMAVDNNWSDNIIYFCKNISKIPYYYLNSLTEANTKNDINFECLFLYYHPDKIKNSHLNDNCLDLVFNKIYQYTPYKDFTNYNIEFLNSLGLGIYKFLEIAYQHSPHSVSDFLMKEYNTFINFLPAPANDLFIHEKSLLHILLENIDELPQHLQQSFNNNVIFHFKDVLINNKNFVQSVLLKSSPDSFLFNFVTKNNILPEHEMSAFIFSLMTKIITGENNSESNFINKLSSFDYEVLNNFNSHLPFSIAIIQQQYSSSDYPNRDQSLIMIQQNFDKALLNKKLHNTLISENIKKEKKLKI